MVFSNDHSACLVPSFVLLVIVRQKLIYLRYIHLYLFVLLFKLNIAIAYRL